MNADEELLLLKGADEGVCLHAGQVCVETESCGCPCCFCVAEADEARRRDEDDELGAFDMAPGQ